MLTTQILLVMTGILIGVALKYMGSLIKLPYTVTLFAIGIIIGVISDTNWLSGNAFFGEGIRMVSNLDPDFILYVFLPILVFDAAYEMNLHVFRKTLLNASILAGPGLVVCMLLTAAFAMWVITLWRGYYDAELWTYALMFGGLISATDPVAVVALLQELGTSKRFSTLVDGESLLNDGTGLVCFMMFYSAFSGGEHISHPLLYFVWVVLASGIIGFLVARLALRLILHMGQNEMVQNCVVVAAAYLTFMIAQSAFDVSGVIALVVFGQYFAQSGRPHLKPAVNEFMEKFWSFLAFIANTLIFLIVGIVISTRVEFSWTLIGGIVVMFVALNVIRYIMIALFYPILSRNGYGLNWRESIILGWGGLRGALGMSMALMVSCNENIPEPIRNTILVYTAGIVALTLCVNATTSSWLVARLRLIPAISASEQQMRNQLLRLVRRHDEKTLDGLRSNPYLAKADWAEVESKMVVAEETEKAAEAVSADEMLVVVRSALLAHESAVADDYYNTGILSYRSYRRILEAIAELNDFEGRKPVCEIELEREINRQSWIRRRSTRITDACNLCRGYAMIMMDCRRFLDETVRLSIFDLSIEQEALETVRAEVDRLITQSTTLLDEYSHLNPDIFRRGVTDKATRMLLASERAMVERLRHDGVLSQDAVDALLGDIARRQGLEIVG